MTNTKWYNKPSPYLLTFFLVFCSQTVMAQTSSHKTVLSLFKKHSAGSESFITDNVPLKKALSKIEKKYNVVFLYQSGLLDHQNATKSLPDEGLMSLLQDLFKNRDLTYKELGGRTFGIVKKKRPPKTKLKIIAHRVTGRVTRADNGTTLPAVNVSVKGTTIGTTTNKNGFYSINAPIAQDTLVFSFIGFKTKTVPINGRSVINAKLQTKTFSGKQLVVIGYGTQQKQNVNGAVSHISSKEISNIPKVTVSQLLQGRAAGVTVGTNSGMPGAAVSVRIRGVTSITGNNEPLYVIDGVPVSGDANNNATSGRSVANNFGGQDNNTVSPLGGLNPNDIKSITILKDASATAIYGSRGANGVVIIKTKKGQAGNNNISYNGYVGVQEVARTLNLMNLRQYARLSNELTALYGEQPNPAFARPDILGEGTNWQNAVFRHALMQNHNLSFSGGNTNVNYYISGGYLKKKGILIGSNFKRYSLNTNINSQVTPWLKTGVRVNGSVSHLNQPINGSATGAISLALTQSPAQAVHNLDGTFTGPHKNANGQTVGQTNPIARALLTTNIVDRKKFLGNLYAQINLTKGLSFKSSFGGNVVIAQPEVFKPTFHRGTAERDISSATVRRQNYNYWDWKNYFTYKHTFPAENQITWLLGQEAQKSTWQGISASGQGFLSNKLHTLNLAQPDGASNSGFKGEYTMLSYYTRLLYSFEQKYGLTASLRADGSSKFDEGHRWGYFPSIAGHWSMYKEPWMKGFDNIVNKLVIKAGYGVTGSQDIGNYLYTSNLTPIATGLGTGFAVGNISNPNLTWEQEKQLNLGVTFGFLRNRLKANVEVYNKISSRFLHTLPLPFYLRGGPAYLGGINPPTVNLGKMRNRGIDVTLEYQTQSSKNFTWSSKLVFSHNNNKVEALKNTASITTTYSTGFITSHITKTVKDKPVGLFYGYKVKGLFNDSTTIHSQPIQFKTSFNPDSTWLGDIQYVNVNGDSVVNSEDRTFIGNPHPDFTFGFNNTFNYKNFSLNIFLQGAYGNDILDLSRQLITGLNRPYRNQLAVASDFWTPNNREAKFPRPRAGDGNQNLKISDRYVEDGSYLRIKNLRLSYTLPQTITQKFEVSKLRVYGSVQNLYTFTHYPGLDPDVGDVNQSALKAGIDNGRYPEARIFTFGINVDF